MGKLLGFLFGGRKATREKLEQVGCQFSHSNVATIPRLARWFLLPFLFSVGDPFPPVFLTKSARLVPPPL